MLDRKYLEEIWKDQRKRYGLLFILIMLSFLLLSLLAPEVNDKKIVIVSDEHNKSVEPLIRQYEKESGNRILMEYKKPSEINKMLQSGEVNADAIWAASTLWLVIYDNHYLAKQSQSITHSYIVFGITKNKLKQLGFSEGHTKMADIISAIQKNQLRIAIPSILKDSVGAAAYMSFLHACNNPSHVLTEEFLDSPKCEKDMKMIIQNIIKYDNHDSLIELLSKEKIDGVVDYESRIAEINSVITGKKGDPLEVMRPLDMVNYIDSPFVFIDKGNKDKYTVFRELQEYLHLKTSQNKINTPIANHNSRDADIQQDPQAFKNVILKAFEKYQKSFKKPTHFIFLLDYSGSMKGEGHEELKSATRQLFVDNSKKDLVLQFNVNDKITILPFNTKIIATWRAKTISDNELDNLQRLIENLIPKGNTDIYTALAKAVQMFCNNTDQKAIILLTDGKNNVGTGEKILQKTLKTCSDNISVFSIMLGKADRDQLERISKLMNGKVFDGRDTLFEAFKEIKGLN